MRTMIAAGLLALAPLGAPSLQQTPAAPPPAGPAAGAPAGRPAASPRPAHAGQPSTAPAAATSMEAPKLPPFAGEIVNFDRRGTRVVACVDAAKVDVPPRPGPDGKPVARPTPPARPGRHGCASGCSSAR